MKFYKVTFLNFTLTLFVLLPVFGQNKYEISADLTKVKNDRVKVVVKTPAVKEEKIDWVVPKVIPGSYSVKDFGRFVADFTAFDSNGKKLPVKKEGNNVFSISNARTLARIEYLVDDTWDAPDDNFIFQPGGTNIEAKKNFVINHQGFWGYLEGYKMLPYEITIKKPKNFYGSTALAKKEETSTKDVLVAPDYVKLVDNPVMYCKPDTVSFMSGNTRVHVSVFSETGMVNSVQVKEYLTPLAMSLNRFFVKMPVDNYHFIMYFPEFKNKSITKNGGFGALEHSMSSFYFLPEMDSKERLKSMVLSIAAHEFLHILTPLNIHSEEIANFDFRNPEMSQHLWMYEGVTEYFADLVQLRFNLTTYEDFKAEIAGKISKASEFPDVSFTEMSKNILEPKYKDMYMNVYYKGALIGFLLDIRLHELSRGKFGLKDLMLGLSGRFGPDQPFNDGELVDVILQLSYPEIGDFFRAYVEGSKPLPIEEYFYKIGWSYIGEKEETIRSFGKINFKYNSGAEKFEIHNTLSENNVFRFENGDHILEVNGVPLATSNYEKLLAPIVEPESDREVTVKLNRGGEELVVKARPAEKTALKKYIIQDLENPSQMQTLLRNRMFNFVGEDGEN